MLSHYSYYWTPKKGYALSNPGKKSYKTFKRAVKACTGISDCVGVTRYQFP